MKRILSIALVAIALMAFGGCKGKKQKAEREDTNLARQVYVAEVNPVEVMTLTKRDFHKQIISNGKLEAQRKASLAFQTSGKLAAINVSNGSAVREGDILAVLDTTDTRMGLESAEVAYRKAELDLRDRMLDFGYTSGTELSSIPSETMQVIYLRSGYLDAQHSLRTAQLAHERSILRAPFSGKIADIKQKVYEQAGDSFCTVIDDAVFNVNFAVLESEVEFIRTGQTVRVHSFNDPEHVVEGRITGINPTVDTNGQIQVTAQIRNNGRMIDGMNVRILISNVVPAQLVVPKSAVVIRDNEEVLFCYVDGKALWTYVRTTAANSSEYAVTANIERGADLSEGDLIIISGNLNLGNNTRVEILEN